MIIHINWNTYFKTNKISDFVGTCVRADILNLFYSRGQKIVDHLLKKIYSLSYYNSLSTIDNSILLIKILSRNNIYSDPSLVNRLENSFIMLVC